MSRHWIPNPTGKGGFADNPDNSAKGRWKKENSQSYCLNYFLQLSEEQFLAWEKENPPSKRTVAQALAFARVMKARKELPDYKEVVDRTEGKPMQYSEINANVKTGDILSDETMAELDKMYAKNNPTNKE